MKPQVIPIVTVTIAALACAARPAHAQYFNVGTFQKPTVTGVQQVAHGLPAACSCSPTAMIFWTNGNTGSGTSGTTYYWGFGVSDGGVTTSRSVAASGLNGVGANLPNAARRMAQAAITMVKAGASITVPGEGDLRQLPAGVPWDTTYFYFNWTAVDATGYIIHFLAIGGSSVQAKVVDWTSPSGTGTATYNGLSFLPAAVLHFGDFDTNATLPHNATDGGFMLGVMDAGGDQWANTFYVRNNSASSTTATARAQLSGNVATLVGVDSAGTKTVQASWCTVAACGTTGMLTNGFEVNFTTNSVGAQHIFSLALTGLNLTVGTFSRPSALCASCSGVTTTVNGLGFTPGAVLFSNDSSITNPNPVGGARFGVSAGDGTDMSASGVTDKNAQPLGGGASKTFAYQIDYTTNNGFPYVALDNDSDNGTITARANSLALSAGQFQLNWWNISTIVEAIEYGYLALGPLNVSSVTLASFTATRLPDGKTRIEWRTGYEVDNVGFRLYREQDGKRVRITSSLVPGTALIGISRGVSSGGRNYTWSDAIVPRDAEPVQYWLEDVDLKGKSTWHGPIVPAAAPPREPR